MISVNKYRNLTWIDVESPTADETAHLVEEYGIPALASRELLTKTFRSKVDLYHNLIYIILHFPKLHAKDTKSVEQEIDFLLGKDFLITVHYEKIDALAHCAQTFESHTIVDKGSMGDHAGFLFFHLIKELYKSSMHELEEINHLLRVIEKNIFEGSEGKMVEAISTTNRKLLDFKQALRFHGDVLASFELAGKQFYGESFSYYLSAISGEYNKVRNVLDGHKEILWDLRDTNDSLLSWKTNQTMKQLTVLTFIMLPLTLITGIFGMNSDIIYINNTADFFIVLGAMACLAIFMFLYFRIKKWF